ncbi:MAG: FtsX-like permease family protein [Chloroflexi bacterium]|nr:FtsX-like permease family protein [Chloroflexota bacterium]
MKPLTIPGLALRRLADDWRLTLSIFLGILVAATLMSSAPIYVNALARMGVSQEIDRTFEDSASILVMASNVLLEPQELSNVEGALASAISGHIAPIARGTEQYLRTQNFVLGVPHSSQSPVAGRNGGVVPGYFQSLSSLGERMVIAQGRAPGADVSSSPQGPLFEAAIESRMASFYDIRIGDAVTVAPSLDNPTRTTAVIVGLVEPADAADPFWGDIPDALADEAVLQIATQFAEEPAPPLPVFVSRDALLGAVGGSYLGAQASARWHISADKEALKDWSASESLRRITAFEEQLARAVPGVFVLTPIKGLANEFEQQSFLSSVPLLLLFVVMSATVLYFLSMLVSFLVPTRGAGAALLRTRGVSLRQLFALYALEGLLLTAIAVAVAPFIAMGVIALAGKLPYFSGFTGGQTLPVELSWIPFAIALGAGAMSFLIFVVPGVLGARKSVAEQRQRLSRPPSLPFFQRYYLDIAIMVVAGLVFWELNARGSVVSGGLFGNAEVNETLLFAPTLFLAVVALLFMRIFPLFVRYVSGESPAMTHVIAAIGVAILAPVVAFREARAGDSLGWIGPVALLLGFGAAYWLAARQRRTALQLAGIVPQAALLAGFLSNQPLDPDDLLFFPKVALILVLPLQALFPALRLAARRAPVWVSMGLWHMARNPLQYTWLVLLLVLATGLGVLATTVGGTLDRNQQERVLYDVATDYRVTEIPSFVARDVGGLSARYLTIPGVNAAIPAMRGEGEFGSVLTNRQFEYLALEPVEFSRVSWYRNDFSQRPLGQLMRQLDSEATVEPVEIPEWATELRVWVKPQQFFLNMSLWMVLQDGFGRNATVTFERMGPPTWNLLSARIDSRLQPPVKLLSVQVSEPGFGQTGSVGNVLLDDIHAVGPDGQSAVIEDFEGEMLWKTLVTSSLSSDTIELTTDDVHGGARSALFSFGRDTNNGVRGIFRSRSDGAIPVVASASFLASAGASVGQRLVLQLSGQLHTVEIRDVVEYFPTMDPAGGGFIIADLETLLTHLSLIGSFSAVQPNELFMDTEPLFNGETREGVLAASRRATGVLDRDFLLQGVSQDPLLNAGWRAMILLSAGVIVFTAGLGYAGYMLAFSERSRHEFGSLRTLGLSRIQVLGLISLEHLAIVAIGLALGTWAGFQMSRLMVSAVAVAEGGQQALPPFRLVTEWDFMLPIYVALAVIVLAALFRLGRGMARMSLHTISRMEE